MGLGDVASILVPSVKLISRSFADSHIDVLTYGAGVELMQLVPEVENVLAVQPEQWPSDLSQAMESFFVIAAQIEHKKYDLIINLDTWFMPCFLARVLKDSGQCVIGNYLNRPVSDFYSGLLAKRYDQEFFQTQKRFIESTFPLIGDWWEYGWWTRPEAANGYPAYYLNHCCGLDGDLDFRLDISPDEDFLRAARGKPIVALSASGSGDQKQYRHRESLAKMLAESGYVVWSDFDGSLPIKDLLSRLKVSDLLISVPTSSRWFARLVDCPVLLIPGAEPPSMTAPDLFVEPVQDCQYCVAHTCREGRNFACMDVPPATISQRVDGLLAENAGRRMLQSPAQERNLSG